MACSSRQRSSSGASTSGCKPHIVHVVNRRAFGARAPKRANGFTAKCSAQVLAPSVVDALPAADALARSRTWRVRPFQECDLQPMVDLQTRSFHEPAALPALDALARMSFAAEVLDSARKKARALKPDSFAMLVAPDEGDGLAGVVEVAVLDDGDVLQQLPLGAAQYAYVSSMAVAPQRRRRGVASSLLIAAEQQAAAWGQEWLALHVHASNTSAVQLYLAYGMAVVAQDPGWRKWIGGKVRLLMAKRTAPFGALL